MRELLSLLHSNGIQGSEEELYLLCRDLNQAISEDWEISKLSNSAAALAAPLYGSEKGKVKIKNAILRDSTWNADIVNKCDWRVDSKVSARTGDMNEPVALFEISTKDGLRKQTMPSKSNYGSSVASFEMNSEQLKAMVDTLGTIEKTIKDLSSIS